MRDAVSALDAFQAGHSAIQARRPCDERMAGAARVSRIVEQTLRDDHLSAGRCYFRN